MAAIIIAGILISIAFTFSQDIESDVSPSEELADTTPPSVEPTQGEQLHLEFSESVGVGEKP